MPLFQINLKICRMKLTVLNENVAGNDCSAEHGLSYFIEDDTNLLFDTGPSDVIIRNAEKLKIDLDKIPTVVLSHGHWDHGNGLLYLKDKKLITHPESFSFKHRRGSKVTNGLPITLREAKERFNLILTRDPYPVSENITFLGEIPRINDFESKTTSFIKEDGSPDFMPDDSALAINSPKGLIVVTGCSHSGICNIAEHARYVMGSDKVYAVIGGFHLKKDDKVL